jgi:hypothetical protein
LALPKSLLPESLNFKEVPVPIFNIMLLRSHVCIWQANHGII